MKKKKKKNTLNLASSAGASLLILSSIYFNLYSKDSFFSCFSFSRPYWTFYHFSDNNFILNLAGESLFEKFFFFEKKDYFFFLEIKTSFKANIITLISRSGGG